MPTIAADSPALHIYTHPSGFDALRPEWNTLLRRSRFNSIFLTWEWQTAWWSCLGEGDLLLLAWRSAAGELVGIVPLYGVWADGRYSLHLVGCAEVADYLDIIVSERHETEVYTALLDFLTGPQAPAWDELVLCNLPSPSATPHLLPGLAQARGFQAEVGQEDVAPCLTLPTTFDGYLAGIDKHQRHEIRRKRGKLERETETWRWFQIRDGGDLDTWVDRFIDLHRLASADKHDFMSAAMAAFFHHIAHVAAQQGWLALAFIEVNGELAATVFNFDYDSRIWVYNSGYNPSAYSPLSPGIILTSLLIEDAIASGHTVFDFLQGNEIYKYRFGATDAPVMRVAVRRLG